MRAEDLIADIRASVEQIVCPWRVFVGLVELRRSEYAQQDAVYAVNPASPDLPDMSPFVLVHPDIVEMAREVAAVIVGKPVNDDELAAWLYWSIRQKNKEKR